MVVVVIVIGGGTEVAVEAAALVVDELKIKLSTKDKQVFQQAWNNTSELKETDSMYHEKRRKNITADENSIAWYIMNVTEPILLQVSPELCKMEDCRDKAIYKSLKANGTENRWMQKRIHIQFDRDIEEKTDRDSYG